MSELKERTKIINEATALGWYAVKIETTTMRGIPDIHLSKNKIDTWIELKINHVEIPKLRPEQKLFIYKKYKATNRKNSCFVINKVGNMYRCYYGIDVITNNNIYYRSIKIEDILNFIYKGEN